MTLPRSRRCHPQPSPIPAEELYPCTPEGPVCPLPEATSCPCQAAADEPAASTEAPCCCKASMAEALRLLCDPALASLVDFDAFFFLTDHLTVGGSLTVPAAGAIDNITGATASFHRFSPCNCDLLDVSGDTYFALPAAAPAAALDEVDQLSLCAVNAVAFQLTPPSADAPAGSPTPYQQALRAIRRDIQAEGGDTSACGVCMAHCDCDGCCCGAGILTELSTRNLSRLATLAAGPLVLREVTVLGALGSVLVLANEAANRLYLVCANRVEALG